MDDADRAGPRIEDQIAEGIAAVRRRPSLKPMGACYNCQSDLHAGLLFCDSECKEDFELRRRQTR